MLRKHATLIATAICIAVAPPQEAHADWLNAITRQATKQAQKHAADRATKDAQEQKTFGGYTCELDCSGHKAGYEWARKNGIYDRDHCVSTSISFTEGCYHFIENPPDETSKVAVRSGSAAKMVVSIIKVSGMQGVIRFVDDCYQSPRDALFCVYADVAGKYLDDSVTSQLGFPSTPYYDSDTYNDRLYSVLAAKVGSKSKFLRYQKALYKNMENIVDKEYR